MLDWCSLALVVCFFCCLSRLVFVVVGVCCALLGFVDWLVVVSCLLAVCVFFVACCSLVAACRLMRVVCRVFVSCVLLGVCCLLVCYVLQGK